MSAVRVIGKFQKSMIKSSESTTENNASKASYAAKIGIKIDRAPVSRTAQQPMHSNITTHRLNGARVERIYVRYRKIPL